MEIAKEQLDQLKQKHPSGIYEGSVSYNDENGELRTVEFLYRKPTTADAEDNMKTAARSPVVANQNLLHSLIVYPEASAVIKEIGDYTSVIGRFIDEAVSPFFGANIRVKTRKL